MSSTEGNLKEGVHMTTEVKAFEQNNTEFDKASSFDELNNINKKIAFFENEISRFSSEIDPRRAGTFRYFCPFFVVSLIIGFGGLLFIFIANFINKVKESEGITTGNYPIGLYLFILFVVFMIIHIVGGIYARNKCDAFNSERNRSDTEKRRQIKVCEEQLLKLNLAKKALLGSSMNKPSPAVQKDIPEGLADAITAKKNQIKLNENTIAECNSKLVRIYSGSKALKRSSMHYFWPFLVTSFIAFYHITTIVYIPISDYELARMLTFLIAAHVFILLHVFGGIFARKMRDKYNNASDAKNAARFEEANKIREELTNLEYKRSRLYEELRSYEESVQTT